MAKCSHPVIGIPGVETCLHGFCCCCSIAKSCPILCDPMDCSTLPCLSLSSLSFLKLVSIEPVMPSSHLFLCIPFSLHLQSFPASGSFQMSQFFASGGQSIGASASASVLPMNIQVWFPLGLTTLIWLKSKGLSKIFSRTSLKASILRSSASFMSQHSHPYMTTGKIIALTIHTFVSKLMSLLFNTLSRFLIAILPRSTRLLISRLQSPSSMILEPKKMKSVTVFTCSPSICCKVMGPDAMILVFWMLNFKPALSLSTRGSLIPLHFLLLKWYHLHIWGCLCFSPQSVFINWVTIAKLPEFTLP